MLDLKATVKETTSNTGHAFLHAEGYEKIEYDFMFIDGVFNAENPNLADCYKKWKRCLFVTDQNVYNVYGKPDGAEPVLVVGGGLVTDVTGFACAADRRNTNFIRVPTTVFGLIDASVSIRDTVNCSNYKNRLGSYHAPIHTFLDFAFLRTFPTAQIRNGFAELIKISTCSHLDTFNLLDKYCEQLIEQSFGRADGSSKELIEAADKILKLETPNLHEIGLDRVIAYGYTWSPLHELVPETPLRHGHAISIDMACSATLANSRGLITVEHCRLLNLFSRAGLSMGHPLFNEDILAKATEAILKTRDGLLRAAVPNPIGQCTFLNDVSAEEMNAALKRHKALMKEFPRHGAGVVAYVDASDTRYTENANAEEERVVEAANKEAKLNCHASGHMNGHANRCQWTSQWNGQQNRKSQGNKDGVH